MIRVSIELVFEDLDDVETALEALVRKLHPGTALPYVRHVRAEDDLSEAILAVKRLDEDEPLPRWTLQHASAAEH